jgi:uncharacterized membrane protein YkvA (DUF1232 family)
MKKLLRGRTYLRLLPLIPQLPNFVRLGWRLLRDSRVPVVLKSMVVLTLLYSISPFDVIPDVFFPGVGYVDDATLLLLMGYYFIRWSPQEAVTEHVTAIGGSFQRTFQRWRPRVDLRPSRMSSLR